MKTKTLRQLSFRMALSILLLYTTPFVSRAQTWEALNPPKNIFQGTIHATSLDASGKIYAAGDFKNSSGKNFVATWNGTDWTETGAGAAALNATNSILTLASYSDTLYAAGRFVNSSSEYYVAKWNGTAWTELGKSSPLRANNSITSVAVDKSGSVYAAGAFTDTAGKYYVAKWNGSRWSQLGEGVNALKANHGIASITTDSSGNVYAAGYFTNAAGKPYVAKWNGSSWSELGTFPNSLTGNDHIACLATDAAGNVYVGGGFRNSSGKYYLAKWNGSSWSEIGAGAGALNASSSINTVVVKNETEIYVAGYFRNGIGGTYPVARWNGSSWALVDDPQGYSQAFDAIKSIAVDGAGNIYAGGQFLNKSGQSYIDKWSGAGWSELGAKGDPFYSSQPIYQLVGDSVGNVYVSGYFRDGGGNYYLQHWNGKSWKQLSIPGSTGLSLSIHDSHSMAMDKKGILYVTGRKLDFTNGYDCILTWDGTNWKILEDFPNAMGIYNAHTSYGLGDIEFDPQGNLYVQGLFNDAVHGIVNLAKWDGKTWARVRGSSVSWLKQYCVSGDGTIYGFGSFTDELSRGVVASYNPNKSTNWAEVRNGNSRLGFPGLNMFTTIGIDEMNNVYVNGIFTNPAGNRYIAKWDGNSWSEMGGTNNLGRGLAIDPNNAVYTNKASNDYNDPVKRWNGTSWISIGMPLPIDKFNFPASFVATDTRGAVYSNATSTEAGQGQYIMRFKTVPAPPPKLSSFTPTTGSVGTVITITGKNLSETATVSFGGTYASSFIVKNDSTIAAIVAKGSTGRVNVRTATGKDSLQTFTYTCDSVTAPVPVISVMNDTMLVSSPANFYQWYLNNNKLPNEISHSVVMKKAGFYHVETSDNKVCWVSSFDHLALVNPNPLSDSLKMSIYPNPSGGQFTVYVKLPQTTTVNTYVQVFDINGLPVLQTSRLIFYGNEIRMPLNINSKGTYFVKVFVNDAVVQQSIIIL